MAGESAREQATADALTALPAERWTVMHDVRWPGRSVANIDHVGDWAERGLRH
jgi:hypothetical protein